jgi:hypothetical protein
MTTMATWSNPVTDAALALGKIRKCRAGSVLTRALVYHAADMRNP